MGLSNEEAQAGEDAPRRGLLYPEESYAIVGACFAVYRDKGCGFLEAVYQECLEIELMSRAIPFAAQPSLALQYRGQILRQSYQADFPCYDKIILEIKAIRNLAPEHRAQTLHYLRATGLELGLLINFGHYPQLEYERIVANTGRFASKAGPEKP